LWQTHFLIKNNVELLATNEELFNKKLDSKSHIYESKAINVPLLPPSNLKILSFVLKLYKNKILQLIKSLFYFDQWALIFFNNKNANDPFNLKSYTKILPPKDRFWADPFLIKHNDKTYLFIEELIYKNKLGHLAVMEIDEQGNYTKPETILVKDYHLSYPFVFEDNGS
ncbi:glucosamine inositolphosphorylceramide transferase family protein, partial [Agrococcus terreus]